MNSWETITLRLTLGKLRLVGVLAKISFGKKKKKIRLKDTKVTLRLAIKAMGEGTGTNTDS